MCCRPRSLLGSTPRALGLRAEHPAQPGAAGGQARGLLKPQEETKHSDGSGTHRRQRYSHPQEPRGTGKHSSPCSQSHGAAPSGGGSPVAGLSRLPVARMGNCPSLTGNGRLQIDEGKCDSYGVGKDR